MKNLARMMILLPLVAALSGCIYVVHKVAGASAPGMTAAGPVTKEKRTVGAFKKIQVGQGIQVDVKTGSAPALEFEAQQSLLPILEARVEGDTLVIKSTKSYSTEKAVIAHVSVESLEGLEASGGASVKIDKVKSEDFKLVLNGGSNADFSFEGTSIDADLNGGASANLHGSAKSLRLSTSGGASLNADTLSVERAEIDASSGASANLGNVHEEIKANASSGASIRYAGKPKIENTDVSSGGSIAPS